MKIYWNGESKNIIGSNIKFLREQRKMSQKALAEQLQLKGLECSDLTILRIEKGDRFVPDYEVVYLADYFDISLETLLREKLSEN